ncbi:MAG: alkaline phosphatase family protein [Armatimonadota bacterium]
MGHAHGENSKEYNDALIECDAWLGKIVEKLKADKIYDKTMIFVTSDHGFDEGKTGHSNAPFVFLATNDPNVVKNGDQRDIVPTILVEMGADLSKIEPKLPGKPLLAQ